MVSRIIVIPSRRLCEVYEHVARVAEECGVPDSFSSYLAWSPLKHCFMLVAVDARNTVLAEMDMIIDARGRAEIAYFSIPPCIIPKADAIAKLVATAVTIARRHGAKTVAAKTLTQQDLAALKPHPRLEDMSEADRHLEEALEENGFEKLGEGEWLKKLAATV